MVFDFYCTPCLFWKTACLEQISTFFFSLTLNGQTENSNKRRVPHHCFVFYPYQSRLHHFLSRLFIYLTLVHLKRLLAPTGRLCVLSASVTPPPQSPVKHTSPLALRLPAATPALSHGPLLPLWRRRQAGRGHFRDATHHSQWIMAIVLVWVLHFTVQCS